MKSLGPNTSPHHREGWLKIRRRSEISGRTRVLWFAITEEQWQQYLDGALIQRAFPHLNLEEREFILTGATPAEWDGLFKETK